MFDFEVSAAMQALLGRYRDFMTREVHALEASAAGRSFSALAAELAQARERARAEQLFAPQVPKEHGGLGLSFREHALVSEVLGNGFPRCINIFGDFYRCFRRLICKSFDFRSYYRKAFARISCTGRLNCCVERQQINLPSDPINHIDNTTNLLCARCQIGKHGISL